MGKLKIRVLLVEDDRVGETYRDLMQSLLEDKYEIKVYWARNYESGLKMAGKYKPHLLIIDNSLPGKSKKDGIELAYELRLLETEPHIIIYSGYSRDQILERTNEKLAKWAAKGGIREFLVKPALYETLERIVEERARTMS